MTDKLEPSPPEMRHATRLSLRHCVEVQAVTPTRTRPLQSEKPALLPCTDTLICPVDGCRAGDTTDTTRERKISGNTMFDCVCSGHPFSLKVETLALDEDADIMLVKPATLHTIADIGDEGVAAVDKESSRTPDMGEKPANAVTAEDEFEW